MKTDQIEPRRMAIELLASIRETDCRIDELRHLVNLDDIANERRKNILRRINRLIDTRFCLVYSFMDVTGRRRDTKDSTNPFDHMNINYEDLKRKLSHIK